MTPAQAYKAAIEAAAKVADDRTRVESITHFGSGFTHCAKQIGAAIRQLPLPAETPDARDAEIARMREALLAIFRADQVEMALDPGWPARIARAALDADLKET